MNDIKFDVNNVPYDETHCMDGWLYACGDDPAVYVVHMSALSESLQKPEYQLFYATMRVYETIVGTFLADNPKQTEGLYYQDFIGVLKDEYLPEWARKELEFMGSENQKAECDLLGGNKSVSSGFAGDDDDDGCLDF